MAAPRKIRTAVLASFDASAAITAVDAGAQLLALTYADAIDIGLALDPAVKAEAVFGVTVLAGSLYCACGTWLASHVPAFGWLLGVA